MTADMVRTLYRYSAWATARICQAATRLSPGELAAPSGASFSSVRETLVHIMAAQWIWLSRWKSTSPTSLLDPREFPDLASIRARWDPIEVDTQRFVSTLTDADLATVVGGFKALTASLDGPLYDRGHRGQACDSQGTVADIGERATNASRTILCLGCIGHRK